MSMDYPLPLGSLGLVKVCSSGVFSFDWDRWVRLGSLDPLARDQGVVESRWVRSRAPCVSLGLSGLTRERLGGRWVHPGSEGSLACTMGVVGFIRGLWVHSRVS